MDEALLLFEQICNHPSFKKTSMILFLNKRDLFQAKLAKKDMSCWRDLPELQGNRVSAPRPAEKKRARPSAPPGPARGEPS